MLKPLTINEIIKNSEETVILNKDYLEFKEVKFENHNASGTFKQGTDTIDGVARRVFGHTQIQEGQFKNSKLNGFARIYYQNGSYYIGMFKNGKWNGQGKFVYANG